MKNLQQFNGPDYSVEDIRNGEKVPVGGTNLLHGNADLHVEADFNNLEPLFNKFQKARASVKPEGLTKWLADIKADIDPKLFASLWTFQAVIEKHHHDISINAPTDRHSFYSQGKQPKLSEVMGGKAAECAELALLAHEWLNREGITNQYFSGNVMFNKEWEFSVPHSFILIPQEHGAIIFDPANPVSTTAGNMPSIYRIDSLEQLHAWEDARTRQNAFLVLQNEISKKIGIYGASNGTNIVPDQHFISVPEKPNCVRSERTQDFSERRPSP